RLPDLDLLERRLHLVELAGHAEADRRAGGLELLVEPVAGGHGDVLGVEWCAPCRLRVAPQQARRGPPLYPASGHGPEPIHYDGPGRNGGAMGEGRQHDDTREPAWPAPGVRLRLLALALLGHGVVAALLLLLLAPFVLVAVRLLRGGPLAPEHAYVLLLPAAVAAVVVRTLWVRFEPPQGHRLAPGEAPELQAEVERLRLATGAPPLEGIVIDGDFNARAASIPRALGLLGHRHVLVLGLPLLRL